MHTKRPTLLMMLTGIALFITAAMYAQSGAPAAAGAADAQPSTEGRGSRPPLPSPAMELDRLIRIMKNATVPLTDAQKVAILGILEDEDTARKALAEPGHGRAENSGMPEADTQMRTLRQSSQSAIRALLSEAQIEVLDRSGLPSPQPRAGGAGAPSQGNLGDPSLVRSEIPAGSSASADDSSLIDANTGGSLASEAR